MHAGIPAEAEGGVGEAPPELGASFGDGSFCHVLVGRSMSVVILYSHVFGFWVRIQGCRVRGCQLMGGNVFPHIEQW